MTRQTKNQVLLSGSGDDHRYWTKTKTRIFKSYHANHKLFGYYNLRMFWKYRY